MRILTILPLVAMLACTAQAQEDEKYVTSGVGVLCVRFTDIKEAMKAVISSDMSWLKSLDCVMVPDDRPITVIDKLKSTADFDPWYVRITLPDGRGASVWGPVFAFKKASATSKKD